MSKDRDGPSGGFVPKGNEKPSGARSRVRAVSPVIGLIILIGLVVIAASMILLAGSDAQQQAQDQASDQAAKDAMQELQSELGSLSAGQEVDLSSFEFPEGDGSVAVVEDVTTVTLQLNPGMGMGSNCQYENTFDALRYTNGEDQTLFYEAGAIWDASAEDNLDVRAAPKVEYNQEDRAISMEFDRMTGVGASTGGMKATRDVEKSEKMSAKVDRQLLSSADSDDPVYFTQTCRPEIEEGGDEYTGQSNHDGHADRRSIKIVVESRFHEGWHAHLSERFPTDRMERYDYQPDNERIVMVLLEGNTIRYFDSDDDGIRDDEDNCKFHYNPNQRNTNDGSHGDICTLDSSGDGVPDRSVWANRSDGTLHPDHPAENGGDDENWHYGFITPDYFVNTNGEQRELDQDPLGDARGTDPSDRDYVPGESLEEMGKDNCPQGHNPSQTNTDADSLGDQCDPDQSGDGRFDRNSVCYQDYNPEPRFLHSGEGHEDFDGSSDAYGSYSVNPSDDEGEDLLDREIPPDACNPDRDGDGYPDFGYFNDRESIEDYFRGDDLFTNVGGTHENPETFLGTGLDSSPDNCPVTPNTQANYDLVTAGHLPPSSGDLPPMDFFRGDACDPDSDTDGWLEVVKDTYRFDQSTPATGEIGPGDEDAPATDYYDEAEVPDGTRENDDGSYGMEEYEECLYLANEHKIDHEEGFTITWQEEEEYSERHSGSYTIWIPGYGTFRRTYSYWHTHTRWEDRSERVNDEPGLEENLESEYSSLFDSPYRRVSYAGGESWEVETDLGSTFEDGGNDLPELCEPDSDADDMGDRTSDDEWLFEPGQQCVPSHTPHWTHRTDDLISDSDEGYETRGTTVDEYILDQHSGDLRHAGSKMGVAPREEDESGNRVAHTVELTYDNGDGDEPPYELRGCYPALPPARYFNNPPEKPGPSTDVVNLRVNVIEFEEG